jgi:AhpD family alkylhydroperoxidase
MSAPNPMDALEAELPRAVEAFRRFHEEVSADGALPAATKKLIMIGISVAIRCEPCIRAHVASAKEMGISREEILEAASVGILLGGGPSAAYSGLYLLDELNA